MKPQKNVLGKNLINCSNKPLTGFYRTGCCETGEDDIGQHTVCIVATNEFLEFSKRVGNDLTTPFPQFGFNGLKSGDRWCICVLRWKEAFEAGVAPKVVLEATNEEALKYVDLNDLINYSVELSEV